MDYIYVVNDVVEKFTEYTEPHYVTYIKYENSFDSVLTSAVLEALKDKRIQENEIRLIEDTIKEFTARETL